MGLEKSLEGALDGASSKLGALAAKDTSPSQRVVRTERLLRIAHAVERLPEAQRDVVVLHYWEERPVAEIGKLMNRTTASVAGLLHRALTSLRGELAGEEAR